MNRLRVRNATLGYAGLPVLQSVNFALPAGSICCLLGANGSGKTTLMRAILGVLSPMRGDILIDDVPLSRLSDRSRAAAIAWVPQAYSGAFAYSVLDQVLMGLAPQLGVFAVPGGYEHDQAWQQLEALGIAHLANRQWDALSGGERQLVLIARALVQGPSLLLLDEPASSLDFGHQISLLDRLQTLKESGMTLLMATHHPLHARAIADSVVRIEPDGSVTQGSPKSQLNTARLAELYRVTPEQIQHHLYGAFT